MIRNLFNDRKFNVLALLSLLVYLFTLSPVAVERFYARGFYPVFSRVYRLLLGWVPFSVGDVFYGVAAVWLLVNAWRLLRRLRRPERGLLARALRRVVLALLAIYLVFQVFWGINYSRVGIAGQLGLDVEANQPGELNLLAGQLQVRLSETAALSDTVARSRFNNMAQLEQATVKAYDSAAKKLPFLAYGAPSLKGSLFSPLGHFMGFTGYYNPFSAEAQVKTSIPVFLKPFVANHEVAHQLGYAKESEANFVAFLSGRAAADADVRYSIYFELFLYTLSDLRRADSVAAKQYLAAVPPRVRRDLDELTAYLERSENPVEPYISWLYDHYLRLNNQPQGRRAYNRVVAWLIAYGRKYGWTAI